MQSFLTNNSLPPLTFSSVRNHTNRVGAIKQLERNENLAVLHLSHSLLCAIYCAKQSPHPLIVPAIHICVRRGFTANCRCRNANNLILLLSNRFFPRKIPSNSLPVLIWRISTFRFSRWTPRRFFVATKSPTKSLAFTSATTKRA